MLVDARCWSKPHVESPLAVGVVLHRAAAEVGERSKPLVQQHPDAEPGQRDLRPAGLTALSTAIEPSPAIVYIGGV